MPGVAAVLLAGDLGLSPAISDEVEGPFGRPVLAAEPTWWFGCACAAIASVPVVIVPA